MSDDENVERRPIHKCAFFTIEERKLILELVNLHHDVLNNKKVNNSTTQQKQQAWEAIHKMFMENTKLVKFPRTVKQVKRCWENMKGKAKKGDPVAVKLMQWSENQYNMQNEKPFTSEDRVNQSAISSDDVDDAPEESINEPKLEFSHHEPKDKMKDIRNSTKQNLDESFFKIKEALDNSECTHCACDKIEKNAKIQLLVLQKHLNEELHQLEMNLIKERLKNERELHKLHVHEMTLKIENERRRAEILDKEMAS